MPANQIEKIAALPEIRQIRMERVFRLQVTSAVGSGIPEWNINAIRAPELWAMGFTGQGVVVANMDSGVDVNHPDLTAVGGAGRTAGSTPSTPRRPCPAMVTGTGRRP